MSKSTFDSLSLQLTRELCLRLQREQLVMTNSILSSCFMFSEKKQMSVKQIKKITGNIHEHIKAKKGKTYVCIAP